MKRYLKLENIIPEAIALSVFFATEMRGLTHVCFLYLTYSIILRSAWNSAIIVHGLGHSMAIAFADKQLSVLNLNNILEHRSVASILKSLVPFQPIFIHSLLFSPSPYLIVEKHQGMKIKALGGIVLNLLVAIDRLSFCKALILDSNNNSIYFRLTTAEQKEQIEKLRESCFGSFERLLAGYVFFWALAKKVASFPFLKYEHWKSQSRTKVMTTASPVVGFGLDRLTDENRLEELHTNKTD